MREVKRKEEGQTEKDSERKSRWNVKIIIVIKIIMVL